MIDRTERRHERFITQKQKELKRSLPGIAYPLILGVKLRNSVVTISTGIS
jgi:hypothetical protein